MEEKYRIETKFDIDQYGESSVLEDLNHRKEVLSYFRNLFDIMGEALEDAESLYMAKDKNGKKAMYPSQEELEEKLGTDFRELEAEMLGTDGANVKMNYRDSLVWPEASFEQQSLMEVMPHEYLNSSYVAEQGATITRTFLKDREPAKKKLVPAEIKVNIELPESYSQEEVDMIEDGLEEFNRAYSRTL